MFSNFPRGVGGGAWPHGPPPKYVTVNTHAVKEEFRVVACTFCVCLIRQTSLPSRNLVIKYVCIRTRYGGQRKFAENVLLHHVSLSYDIAMNWKYDPENTRIVQSKCRKSPFSDAKIKIESGTHELSQRRLNLCNVLDVLSLRILNNMRNITSS